jgi:hypothetical protein
VQWIVAGISSRQAVQAAACQQVGLQIGSGWVAPVRRFQLLKAVSSGKLEQVTGQVVSPQFIERQQMGKKRFSGMTGWRKD